MSKFTLINEILALYDTINDYETKEKLREYLGDKPSKEIVEVNKALSKAERMLIRLGKKTFYEKVVYTWRTVLVRRKESGELDITPFDDFAKESINKDGLPMDLSLEEAIEIVKEPLTELYEKRVEEKTKELIKKEIKEMKEQEEQEENEEE